MSIETIELDFQEKVCSKLRLMSEGVDRFRVFTPFLFDDGDANSTGITRNVTRKAYILWIA